MDEQHEATRQQGSRGDDCKPGARGKPLRAHESEQRQRAGQRARQPPAPWRIAEQGDADGHDLLAQHRVLLIQPFAGRKQFPGSGQIVHFIEIGLRGYAQIEQTNRKESQGDGEAPADRVAGSGWGMAHRRTV
jgi:hypothetical protein